MLLEDRELMSQAARIEGLLSEIEAVPDPVVRGTVAEIVQALLALHGEAMGRMLQIVASQADPEVSARTVKQFAEDDLISHLLLLHDLHPVDVEIRVQQALESVRPYMQSHGGDVELLSVEEGVARLRLNGHCKSCPSSTITLKHTVEEAIRKAAPELIDIVSVQAMETTATTPNFIPMSTLELAPK